MYIINVDHHFKFILRLNRTINSMHVGYIYAYYSLLILC